MKNSTIMKINWIEKLIEKGEVLAYEYSYSEDKKLMFVDVYLNSTCIFPDDLKRINRAGKRGQNARLQYISIDRFEGKWRQKLNYVV